MQKVPSYDIAVWIFEGFSSRYISYIDIMSGELFQHYKNRGLESREDLIISKEDRDADPIECNENDNFIDTGSFQNWIDLTSP